MAEKQHGPSTPRAIKTHVTMLEGLSIGRQQNRIGCTVERRRTSPGGPSGLTVAELSNNISMEKAQLGSTVVLHYEGCLDDGSVFDSTYDDAPVEVTVGDEELLDGFNQAILGMVPSEKRELNIPQEEAYGTYEEELVTWVTRDQFPDDLKIEIGGQFESEAEGQLLYLTVCEIDGDNICLDGNHPLAGENLHFKIELIEIVK